MNLESITRQSLLALLAPAVLIAFGSVVGGLMFARILFRAERPLAISMWLAIVLFPVWILALLGMRRGSKKLYPLAAASWLFDAMVAIYYAWQPYGRLWGW
jgi:hypothetical protein